MGPRRKAREYALQMLFQWDITHDTIDQVAATFFQNQPDESTATVDFARQLVIGTVDHVEQIDEIIRRHAEHWRLDRMATVDRNLLRLAIYEFLYGKETPKTVVIKLKSVFVPFLGNLEIWNMGIVSKADVEKRGMEKALESLEKIRMGSSKLSLKSTAI